MKNVLKIVFVIIGTLIGAGFASGQEMYLFFYSYGIKGIIGIFISSILMGIVIYKTLNIVYKNNVKTYKELLEVFIKPKKEEKFFNIKNVINIIINIFLLITFFIMIAGFGAYFEQELGISSIVGNIILASLTFVIFMTSLKGVVKVNEILVPILIIFVTVIGTINIGSIDLFNIEKYVINTNQSSFLISAILYCSYNSILLIPVLITLKDYIKEQKEIIKISFLGTAIIIFLSLILFTILMKVDVDITKLEMPAVYVISNMFKGLQIGYGFVILRFNFYNINIIRNKLFTKHN